jgi:hypothetical protein
LFKQVAQLPSLFNSCVAFELGYALLQVLNNQQSQKQACIPAAKATADTMLSKQVGGVEKHQFGLGPVQQQYT